MPLTQIEVIAGNQSSPSHLVTAQARMKAVWLSPLLTTRSSESVEPSTAATRCRRSASEATPFPPCAFDSEGWLQRSFLPRREPARGP